MFYFGVLFCFFPVSIAQLSGLVTDVMTGAMPNRIIIDGAALS